MSAISVRLGHLRVARGLTQQQLADSTGLRRDTISALERGKSQAIEFVTLARLCDALGVGAGDILAVAPTAHTAPILGGEDEDTIIAERRAEAQEEIAALIADPSRGASTLDGEFALPGEHQDVDAVALTAALLAAYPEKKAISSPATIERIIAELGEFSPDTVAHYAEFFSTLRQLLEEARTERREQILPDIPRTRAS